MRAEGSVSLILAPKVFQFIYTIVLTKHGAQKIMQYRPHAKQTLNVTHLYPYEFKRKDSNFFLVRRKVIHRQAIEGSPNRKQLYFKLSYFFFYFGRQYRG